MGKRSQSGAGVRPTRRALWFGAASAAVAIGLLIFGVPALLIAIAGNPIPTSLPSFGEVERTLATGGSSFARAILTIGALALWALWAQLMVALLVEGVASARCRTPTRSLAPRSMQALAARLVAAVTLAGALSAVPTGVSAQASLLGSLPPSTEEVRSSYAPRAQGGLVNGDAVNGDAVNGDAVNGDWVSRDEGTGAPWSETHPGSATAEMSEVPEIVLSEQVDLWDLATELYGDGTAWRTIARANSDRFDGNGERIEATTDSVPAGTRLAVPGSANVHEVRTGESLWAIAAMHAPTPAGFSGLSGEKPTEDVLVYWEAVVDANHERLASGNPDLIFPGEIIALPGTASPIESPIDALGRTLDQPTELAESTDHVVPDRDTASPSRAEVPIEVWEREPQAGPAVGADTGAQDAADEPSAPDGGARVGPESDQDPTGARPAAAVVDAAVLDAAVVESAVVGAEVAVRDTTPEGGGHGRPVAATALVTGGGVVLAVSLRAALHRRRELQRRTRVPGSLPVPVSAAARDIERVIAGLTAEPVEALTDERGTATQIVVGSDRSGSPVVVDLAASQGLALEGADDAVLGFAETAVLSIAVADAADDVVVIAVALGEGFADLERVRYVADWQSACDLAVVTPLPVIVVAATRPDPAHEASLAVAGVHAIAPGLEAGLVIDVPSVGVCATLSVNSSASDAACLSDEGASAGNAPPDAPANAIDTGAADPDLAAPDTAVASGLSPAKDMRVIEPLLLSEDERTACAELVAHTALESPTTKSNVAAAIEALDVAVVIDDALQPRAPRLAQLRAQTQDLTDELAVDVLVKGSPPFPGLSVGAQPASDAHLVPSVHVLGPVQVAGATKFSSVKAVDVLTYLAFHRHGATADQLKTWIWPEFEAPSQKAFANVMSRARRAIGSNAEGQPYLSKADAHGLYRLSPDVRTDFEAFVQHLAQADVAQSGEQELTELQAAVQLIRGVPFTGGTASSFIWADSHVRSHVEFTVDESVHRCADLALELSELDIARSALLRGLELVPGCEQCFERRFRVAAAALNRSELHRSMRDLERAVCVHLGEPEGIDHVSPELLDLYQSFDRALLAHSSP